MAVRSARTVAQEEKRRLFLDAAIHVFARKGYHACRVRDIAEEAGVAYGLLYHYFASKEEVLETIFRETWSQMLDAVRGIESTGEPAREQIRKVAAVVLGSWKANPDLIRVLVREVTRSPQLQSEIREISQAFEALRRIVEHGQRTGELSRDLDPRTASLVIYGALEEVLTGWVMGEPPGSDEEVADAARTVSSILCDGLVGTRI
ncbi:MAG TPA: TetR family transcriptional regulator [Gaiellaceae bacterium]|nr:TetR family transcriptional regulator [Gaiellaceae bacterium]